MNRLLCDVDVMIFLFFCAIVIAKKIVDMKKMRIFALDVVVSATCNTNSLRNVFFVLIQFFFLVKYFIYHST